MIDNILSFDIDELLSFGFCKILKTPRYTNYNILVFRNGKFYSISSKKFLKTRRKKGKTYTTIYVKNDNGTSTTMIVPYIICCLFRNDELKHDKNRQNYFEYLDGNCDNCDADNIRANYYQYDILKINSEDIATVNICGYEVLLNLDFVKNELHKHNFRVVGEGKCIYFVCENWGKVRRLHQIVMSYYYPEKIITGAIDHINHNTLDNTIQNLKHINHIINSMNNMDIVPIWKQDKLGWRVRYSIDGVKHSKMFSIDKYETKELAYEKAMEFINTVVIPQKEKYLEKKDIELKIIELDNIVNYFT